MLISTTAAMVMLTTSALAQTSPLASVEPRETATGTPTTETEFNLGDCPDDLLRQAWLEEQPLQTAAVEAEVLALCTERAEAIAGFLRTRAIQDAALGRLQGSQATASAVSTPPAPANGQIETLRLEISQLQARIARLEEGPQQPETDERLTQLRAELEAVESELARAEATTGSGAIRSVSTPNRERPAPTVDAATVGTVQTDPGSTSRPDPEAIAPAEDLTTQADTGPPANGNTPTRTGADTPTTLHQPAPVWTVVHAVRRGDGPWQVRLSGTQDIAIQIPGLTETDPPRIEWRTDPLPPVTLAVGQALPDGRVLKSVTSDGVTFTTPNAGSSFIAFASDGDNDPGTLEWKVINLSDATGGGS